MSCFAGWFSSLPRYAFPKYLLKYSWPVFPSRPSTLAMQACEYIPLWSHVHDWPEALPPPIGILGNVRPRIQPTAPLDELLRQGLLDRGVFRPASRPGSSDPSGRSGGRDCTRTTHSAPSLGRLPRTRSGHADAARPLSSVGFSHSSSSRNCSRRWIASPAEACKENEDFYGNCEEACNRHDGDCGVAALRRGRAW